MATCILMLFAVSPFLEHSHSPLVAYQAGWHYSISCIQVIVRISNSQTRKFEQNHISE